ncbi:MAG: PilZ domain-containing protein [Leptospirillia bacterium]
MPERGPAPKVSGGTREFRRQNLRFPVRLMVSGREVEGKTASLGMGGMFLNCTRKISPDTVLKLRMMPGQTASFGPLELEGKVAYLMDGGVGIRFTAFTPDNYRRLREVLVYHASASQK